jgi:hypothetical protein
MRIARAERWKAPALLAILASRAEVSMDSPAQSTTKGRGLLGIKPLAFTNCLKLLSKTMIGHNMEAFSAEMRWCFWEKVQNK